MNRRNFLQSISAVTATLALPSCARRTAVPASEKHIMTVRGPLRSAEMGVTLTHEHLLASFQPYDDWAKQPLAYDLDEVAEVALPHLRRIQELGCRTFVDATAVGLGRDPRLLRQLSERSGLNILAATGNYAAFDNQFLRPYVYTDSLQALAQRWIDEFEQGIDGTDVRPGFIKLGFNGGPLSPVEQKLIRAAAIAHRKTGLPIGAHTGPAIAAFEQLAILKEERIDPSVWIWIHAHNEQDFSRHVEAAKQGAWISLDGISPDSIDAHIEMLMNLRSADLLYRTLISQDAGWYWVGKPGGGEFRPFDTVFTAFIPALRSRGLTQAEIDMLLIGNPAEAFTIRFGNTI